VPHGNIQRLDGLQGHRDLPADQGLVQHAPAHDGHPLDGDLKYPVLAFPRDRHLKVNLGAEGKGKRWWHARRHKGTRRFLVGPSARTGLAAPSYPLVSDGQGRDSVDVLLPIVDWLSVAEDLRFEVLHHVLHDLPTQPSAASRGAGGEKEEVAFAGLLTARRLLRPARPQPRCPGHCEPQGSTEQS